MRSIEKSFMPVTTGQEEFMTQANCCRSASGDVDMMEAMWVVGARVESDGAQSVLDAG